MAELPLPKWRKEELIALADRAKVLEKDAERIDWLGQVKHGVTINPPGEHGGELSNWLVTVEGESGWAESEDEGPTIRAAIDAAIDAAIAKEPKT